MNRATFRGRRIVGFGLVVLAIAAAIGLRLLAQSTSPPLVLVEDSVYSQNDDLRGRLVALGMDVRESYGSFALASLTAEQRALLEQHQFRITDLPDRTRTGRGAYVFDTRYGEPPMPDGLRIDPLVDPNYNTYILQFIGPINPRWLDAIRAAPAEVFEYLPSYSFVVAMSQEAIQHVRGLPFVQWIGVYHPAYKISPSLLLPGTTDRAMIVMGFPRRSPDRVEQLIVSWGGAVAQRWTVAEAFRLRASMPPGGLVQLARLPEVSWIDVDVAPSFMNDDATWVVQTNIGPPTRGPDRVVHDKGITGSGQLVTVADSGIDANTEALSGAGKIAATIDVCQQPCPDPTEECIGKGAHGTAAAGIIAGDAPDTGEYNLQDGHAFEARLIEETMGGITPATPFEPIICRYYAPSFNAGARIHANGFGTVVSDCTTPVGYCTGAADTDRFVWDKLHESPPGHFLITIGAGNEGATAPPDLPSKIRCEAQAKNVITVGATKNGSAANAMRLSSSWGPACDGRRKPTVVAPGEAICTASLSTQGGTCSGDAAHPQYVERSGTSFAHPAIAGSAALVRQYFTDGWYPSGVTGGSPPIEPSAALIKAVLINGAVQMTDPSANADGIGYPNNVQGWGRVLLDNSLYFGGAAPDPLKLLAIDEWPSWSGFSATGEQREYRMQVVGASDSFEVTLVWTDYPGDPGVSPNLRNDVNLVVKDPGCVEYKGNVFSGGQSATGGSSDALNVEEGVLRNSPALGVWSVLVKAANIVQGGQTFALAATGRMATAGGSGVNFVANPPDVRATSEAPPGLPPTKGTVVGSYTQTWQSDDISEQIQEVPEGDTRVLEHVWQFDDAPLTVSGCLTLNIEGRRSANSNDAFRFYWSKDGSTWTWIANAEINKPFEIVGGVNYPFSTAAQVTGTIYIKVMDTNRTSTDTVSDSVYIDRLEIR